MILASLGARAKALIRKRGVFGAARRLAKVLYLKVVPRHAPPHPFDVEHGVSTGGLLFAKKIRSGHPNDAQSTAYFGSQPSIFRTGLSYWIDELRETGQHPRDFTFVDIGCGKGRALMLASELPFRQVIGIELSPEMVSIANRNLAIWASRPHLCRDLRALEADVLAFELPQGPTLLYMYHPFEVELFGRWVESLRATLPTRTAPLYLLYANPLFEEQLERLPDAHRVWTGFIQFTVEERAAHLFGGTAEQVSLYRLTPPAIRPGPQTLP